jgi:opacity protein-like surface antigen
MARIKPISLNKSTRTLTMSVLVALLLSPALAQEEGTFFGSEANGKWIIGGKVGQIRTGKDGFDDANAAGVIVGYEFARPVGYDGKASIEFEFMSSSDGDVKAGSSFLPEGEAGQWNAELTNIFFAYRTAGKVYFKAKLGGQRTKQTFKITGDSVDNDEVAFAFGVGLGIKLAEWARLEVEYSQDAGENDVGILSLNAMALF